MQHFILLPDLGQTTNEAKVLHWHKQPGDAVSKGEPLLEVETDKVDMDVESFVDGYLRQALVDEGDVAAALSAVAVVTDSEDEEYTLPSAAGEGSDGAIPEERNQPEAISPGRPARSKVAAAPAARKRAAELGVDLSQVPGTGPNSLVTRKDVEEFAAKNPTFAASSASGNLRAQAAMAALVEQSKRNIPHFYLQRDVNVEVTDRWRKRWNDAHPDLKATWNEIFVRAAAQALKDVPRLNTSWEDGRFLAHEETDVLVVAAEEGSLSLVHVPAPAERDWENYLAEAKHLLSKAKPSLAAVEQSSGRPRLAVSNLGMYGAREFAAIIPPGCTSVLAVGAVRWTPAVRDGRIEAERVCSLTISADHRIVDGIAAAKFLERVQYHLNSIES